MLRNISLLLLLLTFGSACSTSRGFNRGELRGQLNDKVVTDESIREALSAKPQLPKPFKVGVYFKDQDNYNRYSGVAKWHWSGEDKQKILTLAEKLKSKKEISDVFVISDAVVGGTDLKSLRMAAAQHGADALLVVSAVNDTDHYTNEWGWTYIALVPALFVPASVSDTLFMSRAAMWDVRNEFLYMTAEAEGQKKQVKPAAFSDERKLIDEAKGESLDKLREEISKMVDGLSSKKAG